jgi:hypothetical protein
MKKLAPVFRHPFKYQTRAGKVKTQWFKVISGKEHVILRLTEEHVEEARRRQGVGDTQNCTMAVCAQNHPEAFSHEVEGTIDWYPSRCYVVSKLYSSHRFLDKKKTKLVEGECHAYIHTSDIWKDNDSKAGLNRLLKRIREAGGYIDISLRPWRKQHEAGVYAGGKTRDGTRIKSRKTGAAKRVAYALAQGALPAA